MPDGFNTLGADDWVSPKLPNLGVNDWTDAAPPPPPEPPPPPPKAASWFDWLTERSAGQRAREDGSHTETDEPNPAFSQDTLPAIPMATDPGPQTLPGALLPAGLRGAVSGTGAAISGIGEIAQANSAQSATRVLNALNLVDQGKPREAYQNLSDPERQQVGAYRGSRPGDQAAQRDALVQTITDYAKPNTAMQVGGAIQKAAPELFPVNPENEGFGTAVAGTIGGIAPALAGGVVGGPVGMLATLSVIATQSYDAMFKEASEKGATHEEADAAAGKSMVAQTLLMGTPISRVLKAVPVRLREGLVKTLVDIGQHGVEFASFNSLATVANNYVAQQSFEPDRPLLRGVPEAAAEGFAAGATLRGTATAARAFVARPNVQPRPVVPDPLVLNAPNLDAAIDAANRAASTTEAPPPSGGDAPFDAGEAPVDPRQTPAAPIDVRAETEALSTGDSRDLQQAALLKLFDHTGAGTVERAEDGGYQYRTTNAAGAEVTHPIEVWHPSGTPEPDAISPDTANAIREHYGQAGVDVVFYKHQPGITFDGAADPNQPDTIFLSNNPGRNIAQVAAHELTHVLSTTALPDGTSLGELLNQQVAAGLTPAGKWHAAKMFGQTAPRREAFPEGDAGTKAHTDAVTAHLINEMGAEIGGEAPRFQSFLPRVVDAIQARFGDGVAKDVLTKLLDGLRTAMETIRGLYEETSTRSQHWVTNIGEIHDTLAKMYAERFGTPVEREQVRLAEIRDRAERDRVVTPETPPEALSAVSGEARTQQKSDAPEIPGASDYGAIRDAATARSLQLRRWLDQLAAERDAQAAGSAQARLLTQTEAAILRPVGGDETKLLEGPKARLDEVRDQLDAAKHPAADTPAMAKVREEMGATADGLAAADEQAAQAIEPPVPTAAPAAPTGEVVQHTTKKGKVLTGTVRTDLDQAGAKALDPFTFRKDGGWFIRQGKEKAAAPPTEHPGLIVTSLETGETTHVQPPGTVSPADRVPEKIGDHYYYLTPDGKYSGPFDTIGDLRRARPATAAEIAGDQLRPPSLVLPEAGDRATPAEPAPAPWRNEQRVAGHIQDIVDANRRDPKAAGALLNDLISGEWKDVPPDETGLLLDRIQAALERDRGGNAAPLPKPTPAAPTEQVRPVRTEPTEPTERPADYGANNKMFTADMADKARERLRAKLNRLNAGFDPEMALDGLTLAGYHIEAGARKFVDYAKAMVEDLGDAARPHLAQWYTSVRMQHGFDTAGMDAHAEVEAAHARQMEAGNEQGSGRPDGGVGEPGSSEAGGGGGRDGLAAGGETDRPLADIPPGDGAGVGGSGAGHAGEAGVRPGTESLPVAGNLHPGGDADTGRPGGSGEGLAADGTGNGRGREPTPTPSRPNFHVDDPETLIGGTPKVRFARNRAALEALSAIEAEGRAPSHEELQAMAGYIGWGSFGQDLFLGTFERQPARQGWDGEAAWLRQHLGKEQWESAQRSIINAHYTDPPTVKAMWDMVRAMGFKGGRVLEPSMGIGNFFGLMPRDLMAASSLTGIELDSVTGRMAKLLYPDAGIHIKGYQDSATPDNFYDLVIGNWPFAAESPADRRYDRMAPTLHDYFFLKALDQTRPGGVVVGITSAGTMDKAGRATRLELARKGELLASFRLPSGSFEKYAGTKVVTDILVLRKRGVPAENPSLEPWINATAMDTPAGMGMRAKEKALRAIRVNQHYQDNPDAVLGQLDFGHGTTQGKPGMIVHRPADLMERLERLASLVPADGYDPNVRGTEPRFLANNTTDRNGSIIVRPDGKLYQVAGDQMMDMTDTHPKLLTGTAKERRARVNQMRSMVDLRRGYGALIDAERDGNPDTEALRQTLAKQFNDFREQHGRISDSAGLKLMQRAGDPGYALVRALERPDGTPARILSESTVRSKRSLENPSIGDAYILARNEQTALDVDRVAELAKVSREVAIQHLVDTGAVLRTPGGGYEPTDQHLSGNVRKKLAEAQQALAQGEPMQHTVDRLTEAIPETVPYFAIEAKLGAPWVGDAAYKNFIGELLGLAPGDTKGIGVQFVGNRWKVTLDGALKQKPEADLWGNKNFWFDAFVSKAMGNETLRVMDPADRDGGPYFNAAASEEANAKAQALREKFTDWAWADPERKIAFEQAYNQTMNAIAKPSFDGSFMDMSGMALHRGEDAFSLRRHQVNAIWRGVIQGRGLFAHEVGTGKAQPLDAKVLTPGGWKRMGEIRPGDVVVAGDGSPTLVEAVFPQGEKQIYRVTFSDGSTTECCDDHLWLTQTYRERNQAINARRAGKTWECAQAKVRPLSEIRGTLVSPHLGAKNHSIPMVGAVQFNTSPLPLDPYVMGVLIGDGGMTGRAVTFSTADQEITEAMRHLLPQDCEVLHRSNYDYGIRWNGVIQYAVGGFGMVRSHPVIKALADTGLMGSRSHEKFIPAAYLYNSVEARVAVLQGLMDTDGTADRRGCGVSFCTTSPRLADDVTALVQSLGGLTTRTMKQPPFPLGRIAYNLTVSLPPHIAPFRLARKAALVKAKTKYPPRRFITAVDAVGTKPAQCIRVAHPSHLYVTDDFIVTHNTYTMGGIAVEGRRYGVFRKPMLFAHNANSATVAREINEMYPGARVLYVDNLAPTEIATTLHRIANEDWDLVVMPHSLIDRMSLTKSTLMELAAEDIANLENEAIEAAASDGYDLTPEMMGDKKAMGAVRSPTAKELVKARQAILTRIEKDANRSSRDGAIPFEQLGIDAIMVDEAHIFKKPPYVATRMRVKGLNTATSNRSIGLGFLTSYVKRANNGRGVYLFTGTPITNTLNEIFNQSRYFMDDRLEQAGVKQWDAWFNTFAAAEPDIELTAGGGFEPVTKLATFVNTDELVRLMSEFTDVVQAKDMPEFIDRATPSGKTLKSPDLTPEEREFLANGRTPNPPGRPYKRIITDVGEMSPAQRNALEDVRSRIAEFKAMSGKDRWEAMMTGDRRSPIITDQDGPKASLDVRNYDPDAPDDPGSKVNRSVRNMLRIYQEPGAAQMVFMETGYNAGVSQAERAQKFILVKDLVDKLVQGGIPRKEIAVVAGGVTPEQKKDIADKMNDGRLRVAIGQTETLGTGVNAQRQLRAIHHLDAPWRPGDLEQRNGRGERQGNEWNTMQEFRYITEGIDGRRWQVLTSKDGFIKKFINAFNDTSGKRLGAMEVDSDAVADNEDMSQTLSAAAGDPRIMLRAKYKGDVTRLERRERLHTVGQADALQQVRTSEREQRRYQADAEDWTNWGDTWNAASQRAADQAQAAGDTRRWYEVKGTPQEAEEAAGRLDARAAEVQGFIDKANQAAEEARVSGDKVVLGNATRRAASLAAPLAAVQQAAKAAHEAAHTGIWHEGGDAIQARIDAQVKEMVQAPPGTKPENVPRQTLATVNGFQIRTMWPPGNPDPIYWIEDHAGHQIAPIDAPTMPRIIPRMNQLHDAAEAARFRADQAGKSIEALRKSATMDFPQRETLQNKRMQLAKLEDDLQANPTPPPGWLRHGAPMDSTIYVNGQPREVRGHHMSDDYYLGTDQGDVRYLDAKDENGQPMFDVHPAPPKVQPREVPQWIKPHAEAVGGQVYWHDGDLAVVRAMQDGEMAFLGFKQGAADEAQGHNIFGLGRLPRDDMQKMQAGVKEVEDRERNRAAMTAAGHAASPALAEADDAYRGDDSAGPVLFSPRPVAEVNSDQVAAPDTPGRLQRMREWAYLHLRGQQVRSNALGADVTINRTGINKTLNRAGNDILSAVPAIPDLIARGERVGDPAPPRNADEAKSTKAWHLLGGVVSIDGRNVAMVIHIQEDRTGHYFYNLNRDRNEGSTNLQEAGSATPEGVARASMGLVPPEDNIARPGEKKSDVQYSPRPRDEDRTPLRDIRDIRQPDSVRKLATDFFGRHYPAVMPLTQMDGGVLAFAHNDKVMPHIVSLLPADVVNDLGGRERAAEGLLRNPSVLIESFPANRRAEVAQLIMNAARETFADNRTKLLAARSAGRDVDLLPALKASDLNAREIISTLAPEALYHVGLSSEAVGRGVAGLPAEEGALHGGADRNGKRLPATDAEFLDLPISTRVATEARGGEYTDLGSEGGPARITEALDWHNKIRDEAGFSDQTEYHTSDLPSQPLFSPRATVRNQREAERWTPEEAQAYDNVGRVKEVKTWRERIADAVDGIGRRSLRYWLDPFIGIKGDDPAGYVGLRNANTSGGALNMFLTDGTLKFDGSTYAMAERNGGIEHHLIRPLQGDADRFVWWVAANRAEKLTAEDRENLFSQGDIDTLKATNQGQVPFEYELADGTITRSREAIYADSLLKLDEFNKNALDLAKRSGLIGEDLVSELIANPFYVPFYRISENDGHFAGPNLTSGFVKQYAFKTLKGGKEKLNNDLWDNAIKNWAHMIDASLRNRAAAAVLDVAETNGAATQMTQRQYDHLPQKEKDITPWIMNNGKKQYFQVEDPMLLTAISALNFKGMNDPFMKAAGKFKSTLTQGVTASPAFMLRNFIRDAQQAIAVSPTSLNIFGNVWNGFKMGDLPRALDNLARSVAAKPTKRPRLSDEAANAIAGGATMSIGAGHDTGAREVNVRTILGPNQVPVETVLDSPAKISAFWNWVATGAREYKAVGAEAENAQRFALYHKLRTEGAPHDYAAYEARDLTDFSLRGAGTIARYLTTMVPFMNARLQGLYKVGRSAFDQDRNVTVAVGQRVAASATKRIAIVMGATALMTLGLDALYADDEDYKKRTEYDRSNNWWFKVGDTQFRIPMGFEIAALSRIATNGVEAFFGWSEMSGRRFTGALLNILGANLSMNPTPQFVKPIVDVLQNQNFAGAPIVSMGMDRLQSEHQYTPNTTMPARWAGSAGAAVTRAIAGQQAPFLSPVQIDYLVNGYFGWLGSMVMNLADLTVRGADRVQAAARGVQRIEPGRPDVDLWNRATAGMISTEPTRQSRYIDMLYQQADGVNRAFATYHDMIARGHIDEARDFYQANKDDIARHQLIGAVTRQETALNQQIKRIGESRDLSAERKRIEIMRLNAMRNRAAERIFGTHAP